MKDQETQVISLKSLDVHREEKLYFLSFLTHILTLTIIFSNITGTLGNKKRSGCKVSKTIHGRVRGRYLS